jgi:phosphoribosylformylglycinamidine synthase
LLPGLHPGNVEMALAPNYITYQDHVVRRGHHCGWVNLRVETQADRTPFTGKMQPGAVYPITVSHGEGRFVSHDQTLLKALEEQNLIVWRYANTREEPQSGLPTNPNGSYSNIAGICNPKGNVVALMPHPERSFFLRQVPSNWKGEWGEKRRNLKTGGLDIPGPGYAWFASLAEWLGVAQPALAG